MLEFYYFIFIKDKYFFTKLQEFSFSPLCLHYLQSPKQKEKSITPSAQFHLCSSIAAFSLWYQHHQLHRILNILPATAAGK